MSNEHAYIHKIKYQLQPYLIDTEFLGQTLSQLHKDFAQFNLNPRFEIADRLSYPDLCATIKTQLIRLADTHPTILPQLVYTIDIPEHVFKSLLETSEDVLGDLSELILCREALKVYFREKLS